MFALKVRGIPLAGVNPPFERVINELILVLMPCSLFPEVNWSNSSLEASSKGIKVLSPKTRSVLCDVATKNLNGL